MVQIGEKAPDFYLEGIQGETISKFSLEEFRGKWVVLFFYPLDFTAVCPTEIKGFDAQLEEFKKAGAVVLGVSVDSVYSHKAWIADGLGKIGFPLLSDLAKEVSEAYGILKKKEGIAFRATFIINPEGIIESIGINNLDVGRSVSETMRLLKAFQTKGLCPVDWKPGEKNLKPK
ncbi:MAG: peroxiredoxin [Candidatus ainarchaeum sp.]|nr:peroxiredoxin [Candidatus ainarchaeum sp.]